MTVIVFSLDEWDSIIFYDKTIITLRINLRLVGTLLYLIKMALRVKSYGTESALERSPNDF